MSKHYYDKRSSAYVDIIEMYQKGIDKNIIYHKIMLKYGFSEKAVDNLIEKFLVFVDQQKKKDNQKEINKLNDEFDVESIARQEPVNAEK